jgi:hypothetical protein
VVRGAILSVHVVSGVAALVLGPLALLAARRRHGRRRQARDAYHWLVLAVCATAVALSALAWHRLWWLVPIAVLSYGLALVGELATVGGGRAWVRAHGWGGSYIALVTALLVISVRNVSTTAQILAWALPAAVGLPLVIRAHTGTRTGTR